MISNFLNENKTNYACKSLAIIRKKLFFKNMF